MLKKEKGGSELPPLMDKPFIQISDEGAHTNSNDAKKPHESRAPRLLSILIIKMLLLSSVNAC